MAITHDVNMPSADNNNYYVLTRFMFAWNTHDYFMLCIDGLYSRKYFAIGENSPISAPAPTLTRNHYNGPEYFYDMRYM
jgi:hypothetical protein